MKMLCDERALAEVLEPLAIPYEIVDRITLSNYVCRHESNGMFSFEACRGGAQACLLLELSPGAVWELDKFQLNMAVRKQRIRIEGDRCVADDAHDGCFLYEKRAHGFTGSAHHTVENLRRYAQQHLQLNQCDLYLMIPGKLEKQDSAWKRVPRKELDVFSTFSDNITESIHSEYSFDFASQLERQCIGEVTLEIVDQGQTYHQEALAGIVRHSTGVCIVEIMVQSCAIGGNKLLNYYCGNQVGLIYGGRTYSLREFLKLLHVREFGRKRSVVFAYGKLTQEEILNALANEEAPMGRIVGEFLRKLSEENVAQYDTAEVYVSQETMFEQCRHMSVFGNQRLAYNSIEIFFVELLLFQDAAIDKVNSDLKAESELQLQYSRVEDAIARCEEISFDMAQAIQFADYSKFNFPTVRQSATLIAKCFGIDHIFEKYEKNKALLETMIQANRRKTQERQDQIKNRFLFLLSAAAAIGTVGDILYAIYQDNVGGTMAYVSALVIVGLVFCVYKLTMLFIGLVQGKKRRK